MRTKIINVMAAACVAYFYTSSLSQTISNVADSSTQANKSSNKYFLCKVSSVHGIYYGEKVNIKDCNNHRYQSGWDQCFSKRFEFELLAPQGGYYVYNRKDVKNDIEFEEESTISRNSGEYRETYIMDSPGSSPRSSIRLTGIGECELKTESLKF